MTRLLSSELDLTSGWFVAVKQQPSEPVYDPKQACFYLGMQLEEITEKLELMNGFFGPSFIEELKTIATTFKKQTEQAVKAVDTAIHMHPEKWVDADCDTIWVSTGAIRALGIDPATDYRLVANANWDKRWSDGTFHLDANGKVIKPAGWQEPDHGPLVSHLKL